MPTSRAGGVEFTLALEDVPARTRATSQRKRGRTLIVNGPTAIVETGRPPWGARLLWLLIRVMEPVSPRALAVGTLAALRVERLTWSSKRWPEDLSERRNP